MLDRRGPSAAVLLFVSLAIAACGSPSTAPPSQVTSATDAPTDAPTASGAATAVDYTAIGDQVVALRGLPLKQRIEPVLLTGDQLHAEIEKRFATSSTPEETAASETVLKAFGLIDPGASLEQLYLGLLGSQVAGFYDPKAKTISVVARSGKIGATEKVTFAHEFDHALQDQSFDLEGITADSVGQGDRSLARLAVIEGDASLLMSQWVMGRDAAETAELLKGDPTALAELRKVPAFLRESLLFPYSQGLGLVMNRWTTAGWDGVNRFYAALPVSTEQVIHWEKYESGEQPIEVSIDAAAATAALGAGWTASPLDTFGEFQIRAWLASRLGDDGVTPEVRTAGTGWGGDRLLVLRGPSGAYAVALFTAWDTAADADEFAAVAQKAIQGLPAAQMVRLAKGIPNDPDPARWAIFSASSTQILQTLREAVALPVP